MLKTVTYSRVPEALCLGRNRYSWTGGLDMFEGADKTIYLEPRTGRNVGSSACRVVIPIEDIPEVIASLSEVHKAALPPRGFWTAFKDTIMTPFV